MQDACNELSAAACRMLSSYAVPMRYPYESLRLGGLLTLLRQSRSAIVTESQNGLVDIADTEVPRLSHGENRDQACDLPLMITAWTVSAGNTQTWRPAAPIRGVPVRTLQSSLHILVACWRHTGRQQRLPGPALMLEA